MIFVVDTLPVHLQVGVSMSGIQQDTDSLDTSLDYEIPEKIRMMHQLALQYVNQVSLSALLQHAIV